MNSLAPFVVAVALALPAIPAQAADDARLNRAFQDHVAFVATFAMPVLIEACGKDDAGYLDKAAPLYFRFVNAHQDRIERGRLLTLAQLGPDDSLRAYRERTIAKRLDVLGTGTPEQRSKTCQGALAFLGGMQVPGEWPPRE